MSVLLQRIGLLESAAAAAFTPLDVTNLVGWWSAVDGPIFTDAGVTPAGANDVVGRWVDRGSNAWQVNQTTAASKPILKNSGALWWVESDGVDDQLTNATRLGFAANPEINIFIGGGPITDTGDPGNIMAGIGGANAGSLHAAEGAPGWSWRHFNGNEVYDSVTYDQVFVLRYYHPAGDDYEANQFFRDGIEITKTSGGGTTSPSDTTERVTFFSAFGTSASNAKIFEIVFAGAMTAQEIADTESFIAERSGVTL